MKVNNQFNRIDTFEDDNVEFGLDISDKTEQIETTKYIMDYTNSLFDQVHKTNYLNENRHRLWFWENVMFIISTGIIYNSIDKKILNSILSYFDTTQPQFLPNKYVIYDYTNSNVKTIENEFNIDNGNYHFMLVPIVISNDQTVLSKSPEPVYDSVGPLRPIINNDDIVKYMIEIMDKYGGISSSIPFDVSSRFGIKQGTYGVKRDNHIEKRIVDDKFFNMDTFVENDLTQNQELIDSTKHLRDKKSNHQRHVNGLNDDIHLYKHPSRLNQTNSVLNRISSHDPGQTIGIIPLSQGVHRKLNDYYETQSHRDERQQYEIYSRPNRLTSSPQLIQDSNQLWRNQSNGINDIDQLMNDIQQRQDVNEMMTSNRMTK